MKNVLLVFLLLCLFLPGLTQPLQIIPLIARFKANPVGPQAREISRNIVLYSIQSEEVEVSMSTGTSAEFFFKENLPDEAAAILMGAFLVGNIEPQLQKKVAKDHSYEGVVYMLSVYRQLKAKDGKLHSPSLERYLQLQSSGTLKSEFP